MIVNCFYWEDWQLDDFKWKDYGVIQPLGYFRRLFSVHIFLFKFVLTKCYIQKQTHFPHLRFKQMMFSIFHLHDILVRYKCSIHTYIHTIANELCDCQRKMWLVMNDVIGSALNSQMTKTKDKEHWYIINAIRHNKWL